MPQQESQASSADVADRLSREYIEARYYEKLLGIIGAGDDISLMLSAYKKFDKQPLISIHNKAGMYLTQPDVGEIFRMYDTPEEEIEGSHEATEAADELVPVSLEDLKLGKRNEGMVLYGELCVEAFKFWRIYTLLEEAETGNAVALSIVSPDPSTIHQSFAKSNYPQGLKIAVKEPRLVQGEGGLVFIDVGNPLSIETVQCLPASADANVTVGEEKFGKWMDCAKEAYHAKEWEKCMRNCTKCDISYFKGMGFNESDVHNVYVYRWRSHIEVGRYTEALHDAEIYNILMPSDSNAVAMKIRSLLSLGRYQDAFRSLHCARAVVAFRDEEITSFYRVWAATYFDMGEAITGEGAGAGRPDFLRPDGDFIGPVEIRRTNNGNDRGLFTTEDIKIGEVLLISKALAVSDKPIEDPVRNGLLQNVKDALSSCGDDTSKLFFSHATCRLIPKMSDFFNLSEEEKKGKGCQVRDGEKYEDSEILHILQRISLEDSSPVAILGNGKESAMFNPDGRRVYYGVWLLASFINHSCVPNAARLNVGDVMRIHAAKPIQKGEEISIPYFNVLVPYPCRQKYCKAMGFDCKCKRCEVERKTIESEPKAKIPYDNYSRACNLKMEERAIQLEKLVNQAENCLKVLRGRKSEGEAWIRSSFMAAYLARIACRKRKAVKTSSAKEEEILLAALECIGKTWPGNIEYLIFCRDCESLWKKVGAKNLTGEEYARTARIYAVDALNSVYGKQRSEVKRALLTNLFQLNKLIANKFRAATIK